MVCHANGEGGIFRENKVFPADNLCAWLVSPRNDGKVCRHRQNKRNINHYDVGCPVCVCSVCFWTRYAVLWRISQKITLFLTKTTK